MVCIRSALRGNACRSLPNKFPGRRFGSRYFSPELIFTGRYAGGVDAGVCVLFFNIIQHDLNNIWHFICASCLNHKQTNQTGAQGASSGNEQGLTCETESSLTTSAMNDYDCLPHSYSLSCWLQVTGGVNHGARC